MSAFDESNNVSKSEETIESYVKKLVEQKGDNWKDPEVIAKGKWESDRFIESLRAENEKLKESLEKNSKVDELIELVRAQTKGDSTNSQREHEATGGVEDRDTTRPDLTDDAIKSLVEERLKSFESEKTREQNIQQVDQTLSSKYGESAARIVREKANEIGMSVDELKEMAATKPKAFLKLMDEGTTPTPVGILGNDRVRSEAVKRNTPGRNFAYYQEIRRKNRSLYNQPETQKQMVADRMAMGDKFYET